MYTTLGPTIAALDGASSTIVERTVFIAGLANAKLMTADMKAGSKRRARVAGHVSFSVRGSLLPFSESLIHTFISHLRWRRLRHESYLEALSESTVLLVNAAIAVFLGHIQFGGLLMDVNNGLLHQMFGMLCTISKTPSVIPNCANPRTAAHALPKSFAKPFAPAHPMISSMRTQMTPSAQ